MLASGQGGLERMSVVYALAMAKLGHNVCCLMRLDSPYIKELQAKGIKIRAIGGRNCYNFFNSLQVLRLLKREDADVVLCHGNRAMSFVLNRFIHFFIKTPFKVIGVMHSKKCPYKKQCDNLIFLTEAEFSRQPEEIRKKSFVLPNTVWEASPQNVAGSLHKPLVFGAMGRLHPVKGFDVLLDALKILQDKKRCFRFVLAGTGPEKAKLLRRITVLGLNDKVCYAGWIDDKQKFFAEIDVFVLSSFYESMSLSVLEALAYSKAVVSTSCTGPREILSGIKSVQLVPPGNAENLAAALDGLLGNPQQIRLMARKGKALYDAKYAPEAFTSKLGEILQKVVP